MYEINEFPWEYNAITVAYSWFYVILAALIGKCFMFFCISWLVHIALKVLYLYKNSLVGIIIFDLSNLVFIIQLYLFNSI